MKRTLALAAAALLCSTSVTWAHHHHHRPVVVDVGIDGYCNIYHVTLDTKTGLATAQDTPTCTGNYGGGLLAQTKASGDVLLLALQDQTNFPGVQTMLQLSYPFTATGTYTIYQTTDGLTFVDQSDGTYTLQTSDGPKNRGSKPIESTFHK